MKLKLHDLYVLSLLLLSFSNLPSLIAQQSRTFIGKQIYDYSALSQQRSQELKTYALYELDVDEMRKAAKEMGHAPFGIHLQLGEQHNFKIRLIPHDLRSPNYVAKVLSQEGIVALSRGRNVTYRGYLEDMPDTEVLMTISDNLILAHIQKENGKVVVIKDLISENGKRYREQENKLIVYNESDVITSKTPICHSESKKLESYKSDQSSNRDASALVCQVAEIALVGDAESLNVWGGSARAVEENMLSTLNLTSKKFEELGIQYVASEVFVSTVSGQPWASSNDPPTSLNNALAWANGSNGLQNKFDVMTFWTGIDLDYSYAWSGVVCRQNVAGNICAIWGGLADPVMNRNVQCHEVGHNWNAPHSAGGMMNATIWSGEHPWNADTRATITSFREGLNCLTPCTELDAAIVAIIDPEAGVISCKNPIQPKIELQNFGLETLTSLAINYRLNGGANQVFNWTGNLPSGAIETIVLGSINVPDGNQTLEVSATNPNGKADENPINDTKSIDFQTITGNTISWDLTIHTDEWGIEVSWKILKDGALLIEGGPYNNKIGGEEINIPLCVRDEGCYTFEIYDDADDGMADPPGIAFYQIVDAQGNKLVDGIDMDYGSKATHADFYCGNNITPPPPTTPTLPIINNPAFSNITKTTAVLGADLISDGGASISERGVIWSTNANPTIGSGSVTKVTVGGNVLGTFSQNISNLPEGTQIYFRGFATNSVGTAYTADASFTTVSVPVDATIQWAAFEGICVEGKGIVLNWTTASENEVDFFVVERSLDGLAFDILEDRVSAAGNSSTTIQYENTDPNPVSGVNYYRLKASFVGGSFQYSPTIEISNPCEEYFKLYPNPVETDLTIFMDGTGPAEFIITLATGASVFREEWILEGEFVTQIDLTGLGNGIYFYSYRNGLRNKWGFIIKN